MDTSNQETITITLKQFNSQLKIIRMLEDALSEDHYKSFLHDLLNYIMTSSGLINEPPNERNGKLIAYCYDLLIKYGLYLNQSNGEFKLENLLWNH
jgi:hypothetical protein